ncbi:MAG: DNA-deoxyinosine glycosylase, partial [Flavobacterium sp.]
MKSFSFAPISSVNSTILILGTMPGTKSLELNQYYGHNQNNFWKFLF